MKEIKNVTVSFNDGTKAKLTFREDKIFYVELSTGTKAAIIRKNKKGIGARVLGTVLSRKEEEELKKIEEFLN